MTGKIIDRGIFLQPSGVWWAWSMVRANRANSLRTRDRATAQAAYDRRLQELRAHTNEPSVSEVYATLQAEAAEQLSHDRSGGK